MKPKTRIFVQSSYGAPYPGSERSISALLASGLHARLEWLARFGIDVAFDGMLAAGDDAAELPGRAEAAASELRPEDARLVFLASDHSATTSIVRGLVRGLASRHAGHELGLIHFDAHSDLEAVGKGNPHSWVISDLVGLSSPRLGVLRACHVIQIGIRDFSRAELERSRRIRRVVTANEVAWCGIAKAVESAYEMLAGEVDFIYVTFDLDAISPAEFPWVHTPKPGGGLGLGQAAAALQFLFQSPRVIGGDLVEYNPSNDDAGASGARTVFELVASACGYQRLPEGQAVARDVIGPGTARSGHRRHSRS